MIIVIYKAGYEIANNEINDLKNEVIDVENKVKIMSEIMDKNMNNLKVTNAHIIKMDYEITEAVEGLDKKIDYLNTSVSLIEQKQEVIDDLFKVITKNIK